MANKINISSFKIMRRNEENTKESHQAKIQCPVWRFLLCLEYSELPFIMNLEGNFKKVRYIENFLKKELPVHKKEAYCF